MTRFYDFIAVMEEVTRRLGGAPERVSYSGKKETYQKGGKTVEVERVFWFDDDNGNIYDVKEVST